MRRLLPIMEALAQHYRGQRQVGHTWALVNGARNLECSCVVIAANSREAGMLAAELPNARVKSLKDVGPLDANNQRWPILIDHHALADLLSAATSEIRRLQAKAGEVTA